MANLPQNLTPINIEGYRGEDLTYEVTCTRAGAVVNLTDASIWVTGKRGYPEADAAAVFQVTVGAGVALTNPTVGVVRFTVPGTATAAIDAPVDLFYDMKVEEVTGQISYPVAGRLRILPNVTRATL